MKIAIDGSSKEIADFIREFRILVKPAEEPIESCYECHGNSQSTAETSSNF